MNNNSFYVLSEQYKKDLNRVIEKPLCRICGAAPSSFSRGQYKGWCSKCKETMCAYCRLEPGTERCPWISTSSKGPKNWCASCKDFDIWIGEWSWACMKESYKPEAEQNMDVYRGNF